MSTIAYMFGHGQWWVCWYGLMKLIASGPSFMLHYPALTSCFKKQMTIKTRLFKIVNNRHQSYKWGQRETNNLFYLNGRAGKSVEYFIKLKFSHRVRGWRVCSSGEGSWWWRTGVSFCRSPHPGLMALSPSPLSQSHKSDGMCFSNNFNCPLIFSSHVDTSPSW